jgi:hypothetical protein
MKIVFLFLSVIVLFGAECQDTIIQIKWNGLNSFKTEVRVNFNPDDISKLSFWSGFNIGVDRYSFGGISYYIPKKHLANLHIGTGLGYDGVVFLKNWLTPKIIKNSVPIEPGISYSLTSVVNKRYSLGIHYGGGHFNYAKTVKANNAIVGFTLLKAIGGNMTVKMNGQTRKGYNRITYNLDFIKYFGHIYKPPPSSYMIIEKSKGKLNYGVKIYLEGYSAIWSKKGIIGLHYVFGFGVPPDSRIGGGVDLGLGLSFSFF